MLEDVNRGESMERMNRSISIPKELDDRLRSAAECDDRSISKYILRAIRKQVDQDERLREQASEASR
jgi:predicted DNA-binding protein